MSSNLHDALALLGMLATDPRLGALIGVLVWAGAIDLIHHRIPNWLVLAGLSYALVYNGLHPDYVHDGIGVLGALEGVGVGFVLTLPFYLLRGMAAGDVKLMAMTGAYLGPWDGLHAVLWSFMAGGVLALAIVLVNGRLARLWRNLSQAALVGSLQLAAGRTPTAQIASSESAGMLPYAVAIAAGTTLFLIARQLGLVSYV